jgi:hypothetical protein
MGHNSLYLFIILNSLVSNVSPAYCELQDQHSHPHQYCDLQNSIPHARGLGNQRRENMKWLNAMLSTYKQVAARLVQTEII